MNASVVEWESLALLPVGETGCGLCGWSDGLLSPVGAMTEMLGWDITPCWETRPCIPVSVAAADVCVSSGCKLGSGGVGFTSGEDCTAGFGLWWGSTPEVDSPKLLRGVCAVGNIGRWPCFSEPERETLEWDWRGGGRPIMAAVAREGRSGSVRGSTYPITLLGMLEGGREVGVWGGVDSVSKNLINVCENDVCQKKRI